MIIQRIKEQHDHDELVDDNGSDVSFESNESETSEVFISDESNFFESGDLFNILSYLPAILTDLTSPT